METTKLSSKGQVIIPKTIRESHHWKSGTEFVIENTPAGILLKPRKLFTPTRLAEGLGCAGYKGPAKTLREMVEGIDTDLKRRWKQNEQR